jgi:hypothetical protein
MAVDARTVITNFLKLVDRLENYPPDISVRLQSPYAQIALDRINARLGTAYTLQDVQQLASQVTTGDNV